MRRNVELRYKVFLKRQRSNESIFLKIKRHDGVFEMFFGLIIIFKWSRFSIKICIVQFARKPNILIPRFGRNGAPLFDKDITQAFVRRKGMRVNVREKKFDTDILEVEKVHELSQEINEFTSITGSRRN